MYDNESKIIRNAIDDCLTGLQDRPSLKARVLERTKGTRRAPQKLTFAMAIVFLFTLLTAAALAIGVFTGVFRIKQEEAGAFSNCISTGDRLYVMTSEGLHVWQPGDEDLTVVLPSEELQKHGLFFDTLLFQYDDAVGLLCQSTKTIWKYQKDELVRVLDYEGSELDVDAMRFDALAYQDGWLFARATAFDATVYDSVVYRLHLSSGKGERLNIEGVLELCPSAPGEILAIIGNRETNQDCLAVLDTASGKWKSTLFTTHLQGLEGITYDSSTQQIYALVKGTLAKWDGEAWEEMQGYSSHHLADSYAIVGDGYVSISSSGMQYLPFVQKSSIPTLNIRGYITIGNEDADFQELYPSMAVTRDRNPSLTAADVQKAIESGDTTDLFHVKLDSDLIAMFENGLLSPLTSSDVLVRDAEEMLPVFQEALFAGDQLFAVPSMASVTVWTSEDDLPDSFQELMHQHSSQEVYIAHHWAQEPWIKADYADFLLTTYIAEATKQHGRVNFDTPGFRIALEALQSVTLPAFSKEAAKISVATDRIVSLAGEKAEESSSNDVPHSIPGFWSVPCVVSEKALPSIPARLNVYVLNPNAENPDAALLYLEYIASHRLPGEDAILKPEIAQPALHPGVEKQIEWIVEDQHSYDASLGIETDELALQAHVDAISADPSSWDVEAYRLQEYRERVVPYLDLRITPLLCSRAKAEGGVYSEMAEALMDFLEGKILLEECITQLNALASAF